MGTGWLSRAGSEVAFILGFAAGMLFLILILELISVSGGANVGIV